METRIKVGQKSPDFELPDEKDHRVSLSSLKGKWVVLYFYPKDLTPGCTMEAIDFSEKKEDFETSGARIFGVSPDSTASHLKFCDRKNLSVTLLSDPEKKAIESFGVWQKKKMAGREYMGVVRSTFLIDPTGIVREIWENVRVKGHADKVLACLKEKQNTI